MTKKYVVLNIYANHEVDLEEFFCLCHEEFNCLGVEEFSLEESQVDEILGEKAFSGGDVTHETIEEVESKLSQDDSRSFHLYFSVLPNGLENVLMDMKSKKVLKKFSFDQKLEEDWNETWRVFYKPINVSEKIKIIPEWADTDNEAVIKIYPGMGFGTGTHETTFLCLKLFDSVLNKLPENGECLDFGCGSGILGIAAIKYLNYKTCFMDIDKPALDNCLYNLQLNFEGGNLEGSSLVHRKKFISEKKFDLVFANILENVLILEKSPILDSLNEGGYLIVSGLLNHQVDSIITEYESLSLIEVVSQNDWSAILFRG
jgi:ribosomal protein L11 methyltransferase